MFRLTAFIILTVACLSNFGHGQPWLMLGEYYPEGMVAALGMDVYTEKSYMGASTRIQATFHSRPNKWITCVIAAAVHMKGNVSIIDGGLNSENVTVRYVTDNGEPDVFFVLTQSSNVNLVSIRDNVASNSKYTIVLDSLRNWQTESAET